MNLNGPLFNALLVPTEEAPSEISIKRALLTYDKILIPDRSESHLIPNGVIKDDYGNMCISNAEFAPYARVENYEQEWDNLMNKYSTLISKNLLKVVNIDHSNSLPYRFIRHAYHWYAGNEELVNIASETVPIPSSNEKVFEEQKRMLRSGIYYGGEVKPANRKCLVNYYPKMIKIDGKDEFRSNYITDVSILRIGQIIKYLLYCNQDGISPLIVDKSQSKIIDKIYEYNKSPHNSILNLPVMKNTNVDIVGMIEKFIFNEIIDEKILEEMPLKDVINLRNKTWNGLQGIRRYLKSKLDREQKKILNYSTTEISEFTSNELYKILDEYEKAKSDFGDELKANGITVGLRVLSSSACSTLISNLIFSQGWGTTIALGTGIVPTVVGFSAKELGTLYKMEKQVHRMPMYEYMRGIPKRYRFK